MDSEKKLSEKESLQLIAAMIQQARGGYFHDSGVGAILWGTVVSFAGFMVFFEYYFKWNTGFDWWLLALFAIIPQVYLTYREKKHKIVQTDVGRTLDIVWLLYGLSIFAVILYINKAPESAMRFLQEEGISLLQKNNATGEIKPYELLAAPSASSLLLLLFAFPTMVTGAVKKFKPMIFGALLTYLFFVLSLFTKTYIDNLLMGFAGLFNWLIPGIMLRMKYLNAEKLQHV